MGAILVLIDNYLKQINFPYVALLDTSDRFIKTNKLPVDPIFNTMLLNEKNEIMVIGNPLLYNHIKSWYDDYIDKNYGSTLIVWDRMFGSFQEEKEQAIYGITKPVNSFNPVYLVFHAWGDLFVDIWKRPRMTWNILFGSPTIWEREQIKNKK